MATALAEINVGSLTGLEDEKTITVERCFEELKTTHKARAALGWTPPAPRPLALQNPRSCRRCG